MDGGQGLAASLVMRTGTLVYSYLEGWFGREMSIRVGGQIGRCLPPRDVDDKPTEYSERTKKMEELDKLTTPYGVVN